MGEYQHARGKPWYWPTRWEAEQQRGRHNSKVGGRTTRGGRLPLAIETRGQEREGCCSPPVVRRYPAGKWEAEQQGAGGCHSPSRQEVTRGRVAARHLLFVGIQLAQPEGGQWESLRVVDTQSTHRPSLVGLITCFYHSPLSPPSPPCKRWRPSGVIHASTCVLITPVLPSVTKPHMSWWYPSQYQQRGL